jgi:hypothetical protein
MLPRGSFGSSGLWRIPGRFLDFEDRWFQENAERIEKLLYQKMLEFLNG